MTLRMCYDFVLHINNRHLSLYSSIYSLHSDVVYLSDLGKDAFLLFVVLKVSVARFAGRKSHRFQTKGTSRVVRIREMGKSQC